MMIAPPEGVCRLGDHTFRIRPPDRAVDVLEAEVFHRSNLLAYAGATTPRTQDIKALQRWCAAHVVGCEGQAAAAGWSSLDDEGRRDVIDCALDWEQLGRLRAAIVDVASLPAEVVEKVADWWHIVMSGGCECPVCEERFADTAENRKRYHCKFGPVQGVEGIANVTYTIGQTTDLDVPWWLYQLQQAKARGRNRAYRDEEKNRKNKEMVDKKLKERGLA